MSTADSALFFPFQEENVEEVAVEKKKEKGAKPEAVVYYGAPPISFRSIFSHSIDFFSGPKLNEGELNFGVCHIFASFNDTFVVCDFAFSPFRDSSFVCFTARYRSVWQGNYC